MAAENLFTSRFLTLLTEIYSAKLKIYTTLYLIQNKTCRKQTKHR